MQPKILLLDDDEDDMDFILECFEAEGLDNIVSFKDANTAIIYLTSGYELPSLIISDCNIPPVTAIEFIETIKQEEKLAPIPIISLCGPIPEMERQRLLKAGVTKVYTKPTTLTELKQIVKEIIAFVPTHIYSCLG